MLRFEKTPVQIKRFTKFNILINIVIILIPIVVMCIVWDVMEESVFKELCKIITAVSWAVCTLHLIHRLLLNRVWFDVNDSEYKKEYIELYDDYIIIFTRPQTYGGKPLYDYALIYFDDIQQTRLSGTSLNDVYLMNIYLKTSNSGKSIIKSCFGEDNALRITSQMQGFPHELLYLITNKYRKKLNTVCNFKLNQIQ